MVSSLLLFSTFHIDLVSQTVPAEETANSSTCEEFLHGWYHTVKGCLSKAFANNCATNKGFVPSCLEGIGFSILRCFSLRSNNGYFSALKQNYFLNESIGILGLFPSHR
jgi:hypothetical protein